MAGLGNISEPQAKLEGLQARTRVAWGAGNGRLLSIYYALRVGDNGFWAGNMGAVTCGCCHVPRPENIGSAQ